MSQAMLNVVIFGPSVLGLLVLIVTCFSSGSVRWLKVSCAAAILLHATSIGVVFSLIAASGAGGGGSQGGVGLLADYLIIGWAVIVVIGVGKYALIKHAQTHR
jgi:hypothetical protein